MLTAMTANTAYIAQLLSMGWGDRTGYLFIPCF